MQVLSDWLFSSPINANSHQENLAPGEVLVLESKEEDKRSQKPKTGSYFLALQFVYFLVWGGQKEGFRVTYAELISKRARIWKAASQLTPAALENVKDGHVVHLGDRE